MNGQIAKISKNLKRDYMNGHLHTEIATKIAKFRKNHKRDYMKVPTI